MGEQIANFILALADSFKGTGVPGYVAFIQLAILGLCLIGVTYGARQKLAYINTLLAMIRSVDDGLTTEKLSEINPFLLRKSGNAFVARQKRAWANFCEGLVELDGPGGKLSALVAPRDSLTRESLHLGHGLWRHVPGLFVSTGLVLTFLGLIAALRESGQTILLAGDDPKLLQQSLSDLLKIASAKFIMSLTGLMASILLGFYLNYLDERTNRALARLAGLVESRINVASPEMTLANILNVLRVAHDHPVGFKSNTTSGKKGAKA
ncbi:MAG: hypothetical protein QGI08_09845 [Paracoccaceae bacterium]|jgi:hypothetical protein|nr:hypothetical protein [Paracoccaceae bacterium]MDP7186010.1 hypothetical protein [Paracoccaceae bacterium]